MMAYQFFEMTDEHLDQYEALIQPIMDVEDYVSREYMTQLRAERQFKAWVMTENTSWVGWCSAVENSKAYAGALHIYGIAITPSYQGRGLSKLLYQHLYKMYPGRDLTASYQPSNIKSINVALDEGFRPIEYDAPWINMLRKSP